MLESVSPEPDEIRRYLASTELFRDLDEATLAGVEAELDRITLDTGATLMEQGAVGDSLFILVSGRLRAFVNTESGTEQVIGEISPGEAVGEMALIGGECRSATVRSIRPSVLVRLSRAGFERLETRQPRIMNHVARTLVHRLRQVHVAGQGKAKPLTIGIVAAAPDVDLTNFCRLFADALSRIASTVHLNVPFIEGQFGLGFTDSSIGSAHGEKLSNWISEQERHHRFVLYESSGPNSEWTRRAICHSDRILIVVPSDRSPVAEHVMAGVLAESAARKDLVCVHSGMNRTAEGTSAWLDAIPAQEHYHVWLYSSHDFDRLARIISGGAFGLVLGGGGARGFAHIGVIQALNEKKIPIDFVGGTSIGALIAAQCALDWPVDRMRESNREAFLSHPLRGDYKTPMVSLAASTTNLQLYEKLFGQHQIEDQYRNYFAVACNLTRGEIVIQRRGHFKECVQASCSLPVLNPPTFVNGDLIVDGALINNLPADIMRSICEGQVIAVDVSPRRDLRTVSAESPATSVDTRWESSRVVRSRVLSASSAPNSFSIVMRTMMLNSVISADSMKRHIDIYLKPPIEEIEMFDWAAIDKIIEIGYRHAIGKLNDLAKTGH